MVWKQDLAKLKKDIPQGTLATGPAKIRQPEPQPAQGLQPLENEDALFLAAMGHKTAPSPTSSVEVTARTPTESPSMEPASQDDFESTMSSLKGLKRAKPKFSTPARASKVASIPSEPVSLAGILPEEPLPSPSETEAPPPSPPEPTTSKPSLIHLAAGMAIEVDGSLDLRGHNTTDLVARLTERILDGACLGWRTLHVILGSSEDLREAFLGCLENQGARLISRYAQAPIPMGGSQAWILYYVNPGVSPRSEHP